MGLIERDDGWRMPGWLWQKVEPLLPPVWSQPTSPPFTELRTLFASHGQSTTR